MHLIQHLSYGQQLHLSVLSRRGCTKVRFVRRCRRPEQTCLVCLIPQCNCCVRKRQNEFTLLPSFKPTTLQREVMISLLGRQVIRMNGDYSTAQSFMSHRKVSVVSTIEMSSCKDSHSVEHQIKSNIQQIIQLETYPGMSDSNSNGFGQSFPIEWQQPNIKPHFLTIKCPRQIHSCWNFLSCYEWGGAQQPLTEKNVIS